jgi:hypothetical protein
MIDRSNVSLRFACVMRGMRLSWQYDRAVVYRKGERDRDVSESLTHGENGAVTRRTASQSAARTMIMRSSSEN